jgi:hypothetical protein
VVSWLGMRVSCYQSGRVAGPMSVWKTFFPHLVGLAIMCKKISIPCALCI